MLRISREQLYLHMAKLVAKRGTCLRLQVGCIIVRDFRIIAMGYNGTLPSEQHCNKDNCNEENPCGATVHAEVNVIAFCAKKGILLEDSTMYSTHSPCEQCAKLIIQSGIICVRYILKYRDIAGLIKLNQHKVNNIRTPLEKI